MPKAPRPADLLNTPISDGVTPGPDNVVRPSTAGLFQTNDGTTRSWSLPYQYSGAVIRRRDAATGAQQVFFFATAQAAANAVQTGDLVEFYGRHPGVLLAKSCTVVATSAIFYDPSPSSGVVLGFGAPEAQVVRWIGGEFLGRVACCRGNYRHAITFENVTVSGFVQMYGLGSTGAGRDRYAFLNSRVARVQFQNRSSQAEQQGLALVNCQVGGAGVGGAVAGDPVFSGLANAETLLTLLHCTVVVPAGLAAFRTVTATNSGEQPLRLQAAAHANLALPAYQPNLIADGWVVTPAADYALAVDDPTAWYPA